MVLSLSCENVVRGKAPTFDCRKGSLFPFPRRQADREGVLTGRSLRSPISGEEIRQIPSHTANSEPQHKPSFSNGRREDQTL